MALRGSNNEGVLAAVLVVLIVAMSLVSPSFFTVGTLFAVIRSSIVPVIFALAVLIVIISGGIDVSFAAIAIFAAYTTVKLSGAGGSTASLVVLTLLALGIGAVLGLVNGGLIARFRLPTLIVTLGTQSVFKGALLAYIGSRYIAALPPSMDRAGKHDLVTAHSGGSPVSVSLMVLVPVLLTVFVWWLLRNTMFGRGVYAIGGDTEAARRAGFRVIRSQLLVYVLVGMLAAAGGVVYVILGRNANPQDLVGSELDIIAAVVLGGASIFGGRGSVGGTLLGVLLVQLINNSLLLVGVPTAWQRAAVGLLLVIGVGVQAAAAKRSRKRVFAHEDLEVAR
ncbi:MAG: ABC transporter permease [Cellulomonas sp.]|nr:ABC transporter permease [Cellulomonas sp.]